MSIHIKQHLFAFTLALIVFLTTLPFVESVWRFIESGRRAIDWHGVEVLTTTVRPGEPLDLVYTASINKQCPSDIHRFIVAPDGSVPIRFPTISGGYTRPSKGPVQIKVRVEVPTTSDKGLAPLVDGPHIYRTLVTRYCKDGVEEDNSVPDAKFTLEVPP